jgi:hypothetical protein
MEINLRYILGSVLFLVIALGGIACSDRLPNEVSESYQDLPDKIDYNFHVRPILSDRCYPCHGPDDNARKANLRLDHSDWMFAKLHESEGFAIVPGKPYQSALVDRILHQDPEQVMPPADSKLMLNAEEKAILIKWIAQGAQWQKHWAYTPPNKATLPTVEYDSWPGNEVDFFVLAKLESMGLRPSQEADKRTLIRRLSFDLTGLPPTIDEILEFEQDQSEDAYEKLVDRLLASPRYGERWCWEWLDVARYADTNGFQGDPVRNMWPWRDWIIEAFNRNMPYDQFTIQQLAGDLLPNATTENILATAFNRNHMYNGEGGRIPEETRVENVFDRVETLGTTWLGLTMNCSRCHDHKFDAISQKEYYQLYDYFNQTSEEGIGYHGRVKPILDLSPPEKLVKVAELQQYVDEISQKVAATELQKFPRPEGAPASESDSAANLDGDNLFALGYTPNQRNPYYIGLLRNYYRTRDPEYAQLLQQLREAKQKRDQQSAQNLQVMVMDRLDIPRATFILDRGIYNKPIEDTVIERNVPEILPALPVEQQNDRLALAKWLVSPKHPLTGRVTVNRYWQHFFGNGIVKTVEDFGVQGSLPTHPELLDWLAVDFVENGWDLKRLFKNIVMSATYRQSSKATPELLEADPDNKYLARATRMRWPSWMLRDQALLISGLLVDSIGGPPVKPYQPEGIWEEATFGKIKYHQDHGDDLYRRTLYTFWRRIVGPTMLFDNATRQICSVKPNRTNTPLHALTTMNDITFMEAARVMASKVLMDKPTDKSRLILAFEIATSREPSQHEIAILDSRLQKLKKTYFQANDQAKALTSIGEYPAQDSLDSSEHAAFTALCSLLLNLDETITRQ